MNCGIVVVGRAGVGGGAGWPVLAQRTFTPDPLQTLYYGLALVVLLLALALAVYYFRCYWREGTDDSGGGLRMLDEYREMLAEGQISEEEFRNIKGRIARAVTGAKPPPSQPFPAAHPPASPALPVDPTVTETRSGEDGQT